MIRSALGLDVGGANLKAAHSGGLVRLQPFELWNQPHRLPEILAALLQPFPPYDCLAVTMTGELCDCFETRRQGVKAILDAVTEVAGPIPIRVWTTAGHFVGVVQAREEPLKAAAANWLALAVFAGHYAAHGSAVVIDVGSTTTDVIPLADGTPIPRGRTDTERLRSHELVYTGVRRTPVCALLGGTGATEWFATTLDVYLSLGMIPENPTDCDTADGRPATRAAAHARLARMLCADAETCSAAEIVRLAQDVAFRQMQMIRTALAEVVRASGLDPQPALVLAGSGEFLGRLAIDLAPAFAADSIISLAEVLGPAVSHSACAHALAQLAMASNAEVT